VDPSTEDELAAITTQHPRVFLVLGDAEAGLVQDVPQRWLNQHGFRAAHEWAGSLQLVTYGTAAGSPAQVPTGMVGVSLGGNVELLGHEVPAATWQPGDIIPLTLFWRRLVPLDQDYNVFSHLLNKNGELVAQADSAPVGGSRPTSGWEEGEEIIDGHGLLLPDDLPPGEYELLAGMVLPATGERLPLLDSTGGPLEDSVPLGIVIVERP
jgi:hypothetical protein